MVNGQTEPIKLFVGQVPRNWEAEQLRPVFEPYGEIQDLSILKDRVTGQHKGWKFHLPLLLKVALPPFGIYKY